MAKKNSRPRGRLTDQATPKPAKTFYNGYIFRSTPALKMNKAAPLLMKPASELTFPPPGYLISAFNDVLSKKLNNKGFSDVAVL